MLSASVALRFEPKIIVDYVSPHGPMVTDVRAIMSQGALSLLEEKGYLPEYEEHVPAGHVATLRQAVASSWMPVDTLLNYYRALDAMQLSDAQIGAIAGPLGTRIFDNLFGTIVRAVRTAGVEKGIWIGFKQADRIFSRMYQGGRCRVQQVGPKDALLEIFGIPEANRRCSRVGHCAFMRGVLSITTKACVVKVQGPEDGASRITLLISWV